MNRKFIFILIFEINVIFFMMVFIFKLKIDMKIVVNFILMYFMQYMLNLVIGKLIFLISLYYLIKILKCINSLQFVRKVLLWNILFGREIKQDQEGRKYYVMFKIFE